MVFESKGFKISRKLIIYECFFNRIVRENDHMVQIDGEIEENMTN